MSSLFINYELSRVEYEYFKNQNTVQYKIQYKK